MASTLHRCPIRADGVLHMEADRDSLSERITLVTEVAFAAMATLVIIVANGLMVNASFCLVVRRNSQSS